MQSKNSKNSKKDKLEGAISNELGSDGIMSTFVSHIQSDKSGDNMDVKESSERNEARKSFDDDNKPLKKKSGFGSGRSLPMIRNPNKKEWWISLSAFITVLVIILVVFVGPCESGPEFEIKLASKAVESTNIRSIPDSGSFSVGTPIYFYFGSDKPLEINKVFIYVENLNPNVTEMKITSVESNINPKWKTIETHFQKEFFENPGKYKISVQNSERKILAEKIFYIR